MTLRDILKEEVDQYFLYTFSYINTVKEFVDRSPEWISSREAEAEKMTKKKENVSESRYKDEAELERGLNHTLLGLKEMQLFFLEPVEKLAATSRLVFEQNQILLFSEGTDLRPVQEIIFVAQLLCPLLLSFKRDNEAFFKPKMENIEVMQNQLKQYIALIQQMCECFRKSSLDNIIIDNITIQLSEDISEDNIENMLSKINRLNYYRMDDSSRLLILFQGNHQDFMKEFIERKDKMLQFLTDLEACAVQLDNMNKGAKISSVVGSSVGVISGILSIVGLALIPVTAGASLVLVGTGAGLAGLSGANSVVTTVTAVGVGHTQKKKVNETMEMFMEHVNRIQNNLNDVINKHFCKVQEKGNPGEFIQAGKTGFSVMKSIDVVLDCVSGYRAAKAVAADLPDLGQAAVRGPLAMSMAARGGFIALNAAFIGLDLFLIVKDSIALSKGSETEVSRILRATAALWKSEIESWQKMNDSLEGLGNPKIIEMVFKEPFY